MTDKEIIIDGVNVNRCAYITYRESNPICSETGMYCRRYDICYYKQLRHKEQECDRYKQALEKIEEIIHNKSIITYEIRDIKTILNEVSNNDK